MKIKEMRKRCMLTQLELAEKLGMSQQTIARWESGKSELSVSQLQNLAVVLSCSVSELLGHSAKDEGRQSAFALMDVDMPYGALRIRAAGLADSYPIDETAYDSIMDQMEELSLSNLDGQRFWLSVRTLNNKILFINPSYLEELELISDDVEAMPDFAHPEVYAAMHDWNNLDPSSLLAKECQGLVSGRDAADASLWHSEMRILRANGTAESSYLEDEVADWFWMLETTGIVMPDNTFITIQGEDRFRKRLLNLSHVALFELPADCYLRLVSSGEE